MKTEQRRTVFISYSHDSPEHKRWVAELASQLVSGGIDVRFDQWDLRLGDDVPKFMEKAVREVDRVLMICTESYVRKANDGVGGVGYEAMVVSGELIRDLGSAKFIPVIRQHAVPRTLPSSVSTRFYIDLSDDDVFAEGLKRLLSELHEVQLLKKPPLGRNPFEVAAEREDDIQIIVSDSSTNGPTSNGRVLDTPAQVYTEARRIVLRGDLSAWRELTSTARSAAEKHLANWWASHGQKAALRQNLIDESYAGLSAFELLIAAALAAVGTGKPMFNNQVTLFEDIVLPSGWQRGGLVVRIELPHAGGYVYQALHGAMCLHTGQLRTAIKLVREEIKLPSAAEPQAILDIPDFIGLPNAFGEDTAASWNSLMKLPERWPWLNSVFGGPENFRRALTAYYMGLHLDDFASRLASGRSAGFSQPDKSWPNVPLHFMAGDDETIRAAYRLLTADACATCDVWRSLKVTDEQALDRWAAWLQACSYWIGPHNFHARSKLGYTQKLVQYAIANCEQGQHSRAD